MNGGSSSKHNTEKLKDYYRKKDPNDQGISKSDLFTLFKEAGFLVTEQIKLDILNALNVRNGKIDFTEFIRLWGLFHNADDVENENDINYDYSKFSNKFEIFCLILPNNHISLLKEIFG